ncbi:MAG: winged helix-turn-helix transcriptional regulator [Planctomycetes bacterium]|nr:winged helix-turn-helix transcriptional regulator [Planctomycetota bacterium]
MNALQLLSEPRRQRILYLLWQGELCAGQIHRRAGKVTFGAVSQHLARMHAAGVISQRRQGRRRFYSVNREALGSLRAYFEGLWGAKLNDLKQLAERAAGNDGEIQTENAAEGDPS